MTFEKGHISWNKGKHLPEELRRKLSDIRIEGIKEGKIKSWNKGLTKKNDQRLNYERPGGFKKGNNSWLGKHHSITSRLKMSKSHSNMIGENNPFFGKHHTKETKKKLSFKMKDVPNIKISIILKKLYKEGKIKLCNKDNPIFSKKMKELWKNPEWREKTIKAQLKGLFKRPTSLERQFIDIIQKYNLPFMYCGNGLLIIGGKNPDFVENNGRKICLEVRPKGLCMLWDKCTWEEYEKKRMEHFSKWGWKCLVLWEDELQNENSLLDKIRGVLK